MWLEVAKALDSHSALYWGPGIILLFLAAHFSFRPLRPPSGGPAAGINQPNPIGFVVLVVLCLLAFRWPSFLLLDEINVDESQLIANALKFLAAPIPWRDVDATTSGPLNSYVLLIPALFGIPVHYPGLRMVGVVLLSCLLAFSYLTIRELCSERAARIAVLPALALLGFAQEGFLELSTEMLPVALLATAVYCFARLARGDSSCREAYMAGLCLGAVPLAKLQAAPLAVSLFGLAFVGLKPAAGADRRRFRLWLLTGGLTVPVIVLASVAAGGAIDDAWQSYLLTNAMTPRPFEIDRGFLLDLLGYVSFVAYVGANLLLVLTPVLRGRPASRENDRLIVISGVCILIGLYSIWQAKAVFVHYLLLLLHPSMMMTGLLWHRALGADNFPGGPGKHVAAAAATVLFVLWAVVFMRTWSPAEGTIARSLQPSTNDVSQRVMRLAGSDRHFAVWGYMPGYYVRTGLHPSTRDAITQFQIQSNPYKAYYLERYLKDFRAARPNIFVEATGSGNFNYFWNADPAYTAVPELTRIIGEDFVLVYDMPFCSSRLPAARIYVRKTRLRELGMPETPTLQKEACPA